ncbi:MAG: hypothetical protein ACXW1M_09485 [Acidimicrobiia bacterium]
MPEPPSGAGSGPDATQAVSRPPADAPQAIPTTGGAGGTGGGAPPTDGPEGDDESRRRRMLMIGAIVVVVGVLAGVGIALATQSDDSTTTSSSTTSSSSTSTSSSSTSSSSTSTSSSSTTTTAPTTTTTTTTVPVPVPRIVSFVGPPAASCPAATVQLSWSTQNASGTTLSVDGGAPTPGPASGSTNAAFDCTAESHEYTLATTGGTPATTQTVTVQNNDNP